MLAFSKKYLPLVTVICLIGLLVAVGVVFASPAKEPVKRNVIEAPEGKLTPQNMQNDAGGGSTGKISALEQENESEKMTESAIIFGKINKDGSSEVVKVFKGEPALKVEAILNEETGKIEFTPQKDSPGTGNDPVGGEIVVFSTSDGKEVVKKASKEPMMVSVYKDKDGKIKTEEKAFTKEDMEQYLNELKEKGAQMFTITPETKLPVDKKTNQGEFKGDKLSNLKDNAPATIWHKARADNYRIGWYAQAYSTNYNGGAGAESSGATVRAWYW